MCESRVLLPHAEGVVDILQENQHMWLEDLLLEDDSDDDDDED